MVHGCEATVKFSGDGQFVQQDADGYARVFV